MWIQHKNLTNSVVSSQYQPFKKLYNKKKKRGFRIYATSSVVNYIDGQFPTRYKRGYLPGTNYKPGRYISIEDADFATISTFRKGYISETLESGKKRLRLGRCEKNIYAIQGCFVDIDAPDELIIDEHIILQRCRASGLSEPTYILQTSHNHYQVVWLFSKPLVLNNPDLLQYWKIANKGLNKAFSDLGADTKVAGDATRYLRNPLKHGAVNYKYQELPEVKLVHQGRTTNLSDIYYSLKEHGLILQEYNPPKARKLPDGEPKKRIIAFIRNNPSWIGTYKKLSQITEVSERAIHYLRERNLINVERIRVGKTYQIRLSIWDCKQSIIKVNNNTPLVSLTSKVNPLIEAFNENGAQIGSRNESLFVLSRHLAFLGNSEADILEKLCPGITKCQSLAPTFSDAEIRKTIASACRGEYKFYHSYRHPSVKELDAQLGVIH